MACELYSNKAVIYFKKREGEADRGVTETISVKVEWKGLLKIYKIAFYGDNNVLEQDSDDSSQPRA